MRFLYHLGIHAYGLGLQLAAPFHPKARKWKHGRKGWQAELRAKVDSAHPWIWFHCASLGEFEQGRNLLEAIKARYPRYRILVTFFSPSGYEVRKHYAQADHVCYLPLDTVANARAFLQVVQPRWGVFVKYELWLNVLQEASRRGIPMLLVSARMGAGSPFFKSALAPMYRQAFRDMKAIFTQDKSTAQLLRAFSGGENVMESSDTRYDRVHANRVEFRPLPEIERFLNGRMCIVAGSTWPVGEQALMKTVLPLLEAHDACLILAPHEIHPRRIQAWIDQHPGQSLRFSRLNSLHSAHRILWIDNVGILSKLYHYADLAYVGGGWKTGLHNVLEAAVFGCPIVIGPDYEKFPEAWDLIEAGGAFSVGSEAELGQTIQRLMEDKALRERVRAVNTRFVLDRIGATEQILNWCEEAGLLALEP